MLAEVRVDGPENDGRERFVPQQTVQLEQRRDVKHLLAGQIAAHVALYRVAVLAP